MTKSLDGWTIVFDLDGTLVETAPDLLSALNHVLVAEGLEPVDLKTIRQMIGHGAKAMIRTGAAAQGADLNEHRVEELWHDFIGYYSENIAVGSHPFDGVVNALKDLRAGGATLCICTNKTQALADQLLSTLNLENYFSAIIGADSVPERKPSGDHILLTLKAADMSAERAIMVGDSRTDERAARNAGLPFIFVPFGYETETADQIAADANVSHYSELMPAVLAITA